MGGDPHRSLKRAPPEPIRDDSFLFYHEQGQLVGIVIWNGDRGDHQPDLKPGL